MTKSGLSTKFVFTVFTFFTFQFMRPITVCSQSRVRRYINLPQIVNWSGFCSFEEVSHVVFSSRRFDKLFGHGLWRLFLFAFYAFMIWRIFQTLCFLSHNFLSFLSLNNLTSFFSRCSYKKLNRWTRTGIRIVICLFLLEYVDALRLRLVFRIRPFAMYNVWKSQKCLMWIFNLPEIKIILFVIADFLTCRF